MGASIFVAKRGGTVVTCAATSGYMVEFDNRHFWMKLKRLIASHFANYREAWEANRLISRGAIQPLLSAVYPLGETGEAAYQVHKNQHEGKIGVLCLAPSEGLGIDDPGAPGEGRRGPHHGVPEASMSPQVARGPNDAEHSGQGYGEGLALGAPLFTEIDHIAIAVHDLDAAIDYYREAFGATVEHREVVETTAWRRRC